MWISLNWFYCYFMGFMCFIDYIKILIFLYNFEVGFGFFMNYGKVLLIIYVKKMVKFLFVKSLIIFI